MRVVGFDVVHLSLFGQLNNVSPFVVRADADLAAFGDVSVFFAVVDGFFEGGVLRFWFNVCSDSECF